MLLILLAAALLLPASARGAALIASFYGDSFVYLPYEDARSTSDIKLQFKTPFAYGLLFAALGTKDYIVVYLEEGNVHVRFNLGSGETTLRSTLQRFDDSRWHAVSVERENETVTLVMDGELVVTGRSPGRSVELNLDLGLFVADLGSYYAMFEPTVNAVIRPRTYAPYRGCLVHVTFNSESVLEMALHNEQNPALRNSSLAPRPFSKRPASAQVEYVGCPDEFNAYSSDQVPNTVSLLTNISYFALPPIQFLVGGTFSFELRTTVQSGVVLINYDATGSSNFLSIELLNGYVTMTYVKSGTRDALALLVF